MLPCFRRSSSGSSRCPRSLGAASSCAPSLPSEATSSLSLLLRAGHLLFSRRLHAASLSRSPLSLATRRLHAVPSPPFCPCEILLFFSPPLTTSPRHVLRNNLLIPTSHCYQPPLCSDRNNRNRRKGAEDASAAREKEAAEERGRGSSAGSATTISRRAISRRSIQQEHHRQHQHPPRADGTALLADFGPHPSLLGKLLISLTRPRVVL